MNPEESVTEEDTMYHERKSIWQKRMSIENFRDCFLALAGDRKAQERVTIEDVDDLRYEVGWPFEMFYEQNRERVQLYEEVEV